MSETLIVPEAPRPELGFLRDKHLLVPPNSVALDEWSNHDFRVAL